MALSVGYAHWHYNADVPTPHAAGGWCWANGEMSEFTGAHSLSDEVLWLTNLPWEYQISLGVHEYPHIKRNDFLPVRLDRLAQELSITPEDPALYAYAFSLLGSRLIQLGVRCYGRQLLNECLQRNTFAQAIAHCIGWRAPDDEKVNDELHRDIIWSNLTPNALLRHDVKTENCVVLRAPWFEHAKAVLSCPIPDMQEDWLEVHLQPGADKLEYLNQEDLPAIVEVHGMALNGTWDAIYDLSSSPLRWSRKRRWMASNEVLFLARNRAAMEIGRIFIQPAGYVCDALSWSMPNAGDALTLSISAGLLTHAHWLSGAIPLSHRFWPLRSLWIRSSDRLRMACMLPTLQGIANLRLVSYGEGALYLSGPSEALLEATARAPHIGLSPTRSSWLGCESKRLSEQKDWLPSSFNSYEQIPHWVPPRPTTDLLRLDQAAILSLTDEPAAVQAIASILKELRNASA